MLHISIYTYVTILHKEYNVLLLHYQHSRNIIQQENEKEVV